MAEERLFCNSIDKAVVDEIKKREKLFSKGDASNKDLLPADPDNLKSLRYTTQRGAWVRMISSVDVKVPNSDAFSSETSKNFILTGGEITSAGTKREGISFEADDLTRTSYRKTATVGVRPEAGITAFSIKHKGTYGSIREAEISFNVWSKEDLNKAQDIYLRPGVHMIVEWGHTLDSDVVPTKLPPKAGKYFEKLAQPPLKVNITTTEDGRQIALRSDIQAAITEQTLTTSSRRQVVQDIINEHRKNNLSYEGFIGLVTNFSWSFREDGGYDCSVRIISAGAVMESLTTIQGAGHLTTAEGTDCKEETMQEDIDKAKKSLMHDFVLGVGRDAFIFNYQKQGGPQFDRKAGTAQRFSQAVQTILTENNISLYGFTTNYKGGDAFRYITIRDLLKFLNASEFFPKAPNGEKPAQFYIEPINSQQATSTYPRFKTFPEHFSLDIKTCFLPKPPTSTNTVDQVFLNKITLVDDLKQIFLSSSFRGQSDNIQSILVELNFLLESFDAALSPEEDNLYNLNVFSFIKNLLKGINNALGNITDLDLHFDETLQQYIIVDREAVTTKEAFSQVASLSFTGISNTVQKVSIQTKITPQLTSQIAISAQGTKALKQGDNNTNLPMIQWNAGIEDRFNPKDNRPADPPPTLPNCTGEGTGADTSKVPTPQQRLRNLKDELQGLSRRLSEARTEQAQVLIKQRIQQTENAIKIQQGLIDREEAEKDKVAAEAQFNLENPFVENFLQPWSEAFEVLTTKTRQNWYSVVGTTAYKADLFSKIRRFGIAYFREKYFNSIGGEANQDKTSDPGLIPIELSITLDGIGGLKIGQVFKLDRVEKFLPDAYKDYGFIITAIDSTIENNKWNTTIKALTFKIPTQSTATSTGSGTSASASRSTGRGAVNVVGEFVPVGRIVRDDTYQGLKIIVESYIGKSVPDSDFEMFLRAVAGETSPGARNARENAAIASVILNRVLSSRFPNTIKEVLNAPSQFQAVTGTSANGRKPSDAYTAAVPATIKNVKDSLIANLLAFKSKNWLNFTAADRKAYKQPGTNVSYLDKALTTPGNEVILGTVFFTEQVSNTPRPNTNRRR